MLRSGIYIFSWAIETIETTCPMWQLAPVYPICWNRGGTHLEYISHTYLDIQVCLIIYGFFLIHKLYSFTWATYVYTLREHSGWPHIKEVRKVMEISGKKYGPHLHTNVICVHVRCKNYTCNIYAACIPSCI